MTKLVKIIAFVSILTVACTATVFAQVDTSYKPLTTLPGVFTKGQPTDPVVVLKGIYGLAIGVGSVIAVVMIIYAGFKYMYQESVFGKADAKEYIWNAILGLFVILGSYIFLQTINPDLVNFDVSLQGGSGRVQSLGFAVQKLDEANKNAGLALKERDRLAGQIKTLTEEAERLENQIADLEQATENFNAEDNPQKDEIARLKADLAKVRTDIQTKEIAKVGVESHADSYLVIARIDENILRRSTGEKNIEVNIAASQAGANAYFDRTLQDLKKFDQNNPDVKKTVAQVQARKDAMNAEFGQQRELNHLIGIANPDAGVKNTIISRKEAFAKQIEAYSKKLKENGLDAEAAAFESRTKNRIEALCASRLCEN